MSDTCSLFPPFGDPWPSCLLPSHRDSLEVVILDARTMRVCTVWWVKPWAHPQHPWGEAGSSGTLLTPSSLHTPGPCRYPKLFPLSCPPLQDSPPRPKHMTVAFLKTHKTAGTTVQNILFRFAERHDLMVPLPHPSCEHQFCHPRNFLAHFMHAATRPLHVLASHQRLDRGAAAPHAARHRLRHHPARAGRHVQVALQRLQPVLQERH